MTGPDNLRRIANWDEMPLEGMPLLHLEAQRDDPQRPGWPRWVEKFGYRREGAGRGVHYRHARLALEAVRQNVGFLICGLSLVQDDLAQGSVMPPYLFSMRLCRWEAAWAQAMRVWLSCWLFPMARRAGPPASPPLIDR